MRTFKLTIGTWSSIDATIFYLLEAQDIGNLFAQVTMERLGLPPITAATEKDRTIERIRTALNDAPIMIVDQTVR